MTTIYEQLQREHQDRQPATPPPASYHQPDNTPQEAPVSLDLATIEEKFHGFVDDVVSHVKHAAEDVAPHLKQAADLAEQVAQSKLFQTLLSATLGPADEEFLVRLVQRLDQGATTAAQDLTGQPVPADPPGDPDPTPVPVPAGPVIGGQAQ